jgi:hypothetical protein
MCETASFSGGGKEGVSDTFASALWALDYLLELASFGCAGVNMETGVNHLGWISHYTPIGDDLKGNYSAAPEYYGLLAFAQMSKGELLAVDCQAGGTNLTAHAVRDGRELCVAVINKDKSQDASVTINGVSARSAAVMRLTASSLTAMNGITLGGASVDGEGNWTGKRERASLSAGLQVPAGSAALVWLT